MWQMITEPITNDDGVSYTAYGFRCEDLMVHDFTSVQAEAESFLFMLNRMDVSPSHVYDVIENYFALV